MWLGKKKWFAKGFYSKRANRKFLSCRHKNKAGTCNPAGPLIVFTPALFLPACLRVSTLAPSFHPPVTRQLWLPQVPLVGAGYYCLKPSQTGHMVVKWQSSGFSLRHVRAPDGTRSSFPPYNPGSRNSRDTVAFGRQSGLGWWAWQ